MGRHKKGWVKPDLPTPVLSGDAISAALAQPEVVTTAREGSVGLSADAPLSEIAAEGAPDVQIASPVRPSTEVRPRAVTITSVFPLRRRG